MPKLVSILFLCGILIKPLFAQVPRRVKGTLGEFTIQGRIVEVNEKHNFVVINLGGADGLRKNMLLSVVRADEEVAKIKATKVRRRFSACDIQFAPEGRIAVGDRVVYRHPAVPEEWLRKMARPLEPIEVIETEPIVTDIDAPKRRILLKALDVFKDCGAFITELDTSRYTLKAHKELGLPLDIALFTDYRPIVRNRVNYTVEIDSTAYKHNRLTIYLSGTYNSEGKAYRHPIKMSSSIYKEAQNMASTIKDLAERL